MRVCTLHLAITLDIRLFSREIIKKYASYCIIACVLTWSEWRDLNPRHPAPKAGALPTALHPVIELFIRLGMFSQIARGEGELINLNN